MFSLESPHGSNSNEYTHHAIINIKKKITLNYPKYNHVCSYETFSKGLKNEFETAVVNQPSVFEPLKFYCILTFQISHYSRSTITFLHLSMLFWGGRVARWCWVNFQCWGVLLIWMRVGQGPTALAVGAGGGCLDIFSLICHFSFLSPSLSGGDGPI